MSVTLCFMSAYPNVRGWFSERALTYHIVFDKSVKLSELHYNVTKNDFFNRDFLYSHLGADVSIFLAAKCFLPDHVNLYTVGTAIQYWAKFPWKPWSENVWFSRYSGSKSTMTSSYFKRMFLFFSNMSIYIPWILGRSKFSRDSNALF